MRWKPTITHTENILASALRYKRIKCTQNPKISGYYPDIVIDGTNIIIEVDGGIHRGKEARERDRQRTKHLNEAGYRVIRFKNEKIINELPAVLRIIQKAINSYNQGKTGLRFARWEPESKKQRAREKAKKLAQPSDPTQ